MLVVLECVHNRAKKKNSPHGPHLDRFFFGSINNQPLKKKSDTSLIGILKITKQTFISPICAFDTDITKAMSQAGEPRWGRTDASKFRYSRKAG